MAGIAVALITGPPRAGRGDLRRDRSESRWASPFDPAIGIVSGGLFGPIVAMAAVRAAQRRTDLPPKSRLAAYGGDLTDGPRPHPARAADGRGDLSVARRAAALAGDAAGCHRSCATICRLVGPAMLATLAAVSVAVVVDATTHRALVPHRHRVAGRGVVCVAVAAMRRSLLIGLVGAIAIVAVARALGWA